MTQFHWLDDAIHNHRGSETGTQAQEKQLAALIASQGLHGRIIYELQRTSERLFKVKSEPPGREVMRFRHRSVPDHRSRIANRYRVILPVRC